MDLIAFRVQMYKGILDSGWVEVNPLTVLVGKNESGKTSLLKALHKLNPYIPDPYQIAKEWPRAHRKERSEKQEVCRARFQLLDHEKSNLCRITERDDFPNNVEVSRNYAGELNVEFDVDLSTDERRAEDVNKACNTLPEIPDELSDQFKQCADECLNEVRRLAHEGRFTELAELEQNHKSILREVRSLSDPLKQTENKFINRYATSLKRVCQTLEELPSFLSEVHAYVIDNLPTFVYMSDYRAFSGTAQLDEVQSRRNEARLSEEDNTFLTILNLSALDLDNLVLSGHGDAAELEQRQFDLSDGAATLTSEITNRLSQRRYEVQYRADGQRFFTFVKDDHDPALIALEERSKGFQWFFSFDLMLMHESKGTFEGCVILMDEPGLHLHPDAQKDLLRRLEHYAEGNVLLYTTHLPFMIDLNYPVRIRILTETDNGIVVTTNFTESPPEAKLVLQAALGMDVSQSFLVAQRNLVVEGVDDYWVLTELSNLLRENATNGLPEEVLITPGGGASVAVHIATFMIGQGLSVVALFDSDAAGRCAGDKLIKNWLTRYTESQTKVLLLGEVVGASGEFAIEDLFPECFMIDIVKDAYKKELMFAGVNEIELQGKDMLWRRIERFMEEKGIKITKGRIANRLRKKLRNMNTASDLPEETRCKAITLFKEIRSAFGERETESS